MSQVTNFLAPALAPKFLVLYLFVLSAVAIHVRGRVRHRFFRQLTDHSTLLAPVNCLLYLFSAVPNKPRVPIERFPELKLLTDNWQTFREEGMALYRAGHVKASKEHDDLGFNSFFRRGWKRFYLSWYGEPHPSAQALCPKSVAILRQAPTVKAAMFALLPDGGKLMAHRDPYAGSLRFHLGLVTPNNEKCRIYIDGEPYSWRDGEAIVFDETYIHSAINESGVDRLILFADVERPMAVAPARWLNRFFAHTVMRATETRNEAGERVGVLNKMFGFVYRGRVKMKALKKANRRLYYAIKYAALGGLLAAFVVWA
jgi:beta-hydroxylase